MECFIRGGQKCLAKIKNSRHLLSSAFPEDALRRLLFTTKLLANFKRRRPFRFVPSPAFPASLLLQFRDRLQPVPV
jgi:hypothetical protein